MEKKILIIGAGVGGVATALRLARAKMSITLVNPTPHFEYHATLYRVLTGRSPMESCIPLGEIFRGRAVEFVEDSITDVNIEKQVATGQSGSTYAYDFLVVAPGSETAYYDIPGLEKWSYSLKNTKDAIRLNSHLHQSFSECASFSDEVDKKCNTHIVVIGGGATGVESAGALAQYTRKLAKKHGLDEQLVKIDLVSSPDRLMPELPETVSSLMRKRLDVLGVQVILNNRVMDEEVEEVHLKDAKLKTKTVIWAAGVRANHLLAQWGLPVDARGRVVVDEYLRPNAKAQMSNIKLNSNDQRPNTNDNTGSRPHPQNPASDFQNVFVLGDSAATKYSGMATTAWRDGQYVGDNIIRQTHGQALMSYTPKKPWCLVPVGEGYAAVRVWGSWVYGRVGWWLRQIANLYFFTKILPLGKALTAWRSDRVLWTTCPVCKSA